MQQQEKYVQFFTATILEWKYLLKPDKYKQIILDSLRFLVEQKRVKVYGFVIMVNHIHIIWHILPEHKRENVQRDFLKYTAQQIKSDLLRRCWCSSKALVRLLHQQHTAIVLLHSSNKLCFFCI